MDWDIFQINTLHIRQNWFRVKLISRQIARLVQVNLSVRCVGSFVFPFRGDRGYGNFFYMFKQVSSKDRKLSIRSCMRIIETTLPLLAYRTFEICWKVFWTWILTNSKWTVKFLVRIGGHGTLIFFPFYCIFPASLALHFSSNLLTLMQMAWPCARRCMQVLCFVILQQKLQTRHMQIM